jgi:hypothetical protein
LNGGSKTSDDGKDRIRKDMRWYIVSPLLLISNVDKAMIDAHFKFGGRLIFASLIFVELFETLQG